MPEINNFSPHILDTTHAKNNLGLKEASWTKGKSVIKMAMCPAIVYTKDIGPCVAGTFWCRTHQAAGVIHSHPESNNAQVKLEELHTLLKDDEDIEETPCQIHCNVRGGLGNSENSQKQARTIIEFDKRNNIPVTEIGLLQSYKPTSAANNQPVLGTDTATGTVFTGMR